MNSNELVPGFFPHAYKFPHLLEEYPSTSSVILNLSRKQVFLFHFLISLMLLFSTFDEKILTSVFSIVAKMK
jgi:hypothetical protein